MMDIVAVDDLDLASLSDISLTSLGGRSHSPPAGGLNAEPVIVRGNGALTVFGLNNRFSTQFPQSLIARVAPEEFRATIERINSLLSKAVPLQMKWVVLGCFCCCCTLGCSFWPVICMNKKTRLSIEKLLDWENTHLYRRLNLRWKLAQMHLDSSSMLEQLKVPVLKCLSGMELEGGAPCLALIRHLILNGSIKEPLLFRQIHKHWNPVSWDLDQFGRILCVDGDQLLPCRIGKVNSPSSEPQWESQTRVKLLSWTSMTNWSSPDEWIYFDYKSMRDVVDSKYLQEFEWSRLGFPERNGDVSNLWIGSGGSYTPCHYDTYGCNLVAQVRGRKRWLLFPPDETKHLLPTRVPYEESSVYSQINFSQPSPQQVIQGLRGLDLVLEPGDVLFVPPKWWHFVKSQDFSISVNTWIEMPNDVEMRVEEGIMRSLVAAFVSLSSSDTAVQLLNPNEEELLDVTEVQIQEFLLSSTTDLFRHKSTQDEGIPENGLEEKEVTGSAKKFKLDSTNPNPTLSDLFKECDRVRTLTSFDPSSLAYKNHDILQRPNEEILPNGFHCIVHLINALGHPDVMKVLKEKFLENLRRRSEEADN